MLLKSVMYISILLIATSSCVNKSPNISYPEDVLPKTVEPSLIDMKRKSLDNYLKMEAFEKYRNYPLHTEAKNEILVGRKVRVVYPRSESGSEAKALPLIISLHGYGATDIYQNWFFNAADFVYDKKFFLAMPLGISRSWDFSIKRLRDQEFILDLITELSKKYPIDPKRIYLVGHSNGGIFALNFACKMNKTVAAVMPIGAFANYRAKDCSEHILPTLIVHGDQDKVVRYSLSRHTFRKMARINYCEAEPRKAEDETLIGEHYVGCAYDARVSLYTVKGANHTDPIQRKIVSNLLNELLSLKLLEPVR